MRGRFSNRDQECFGTSLANYFDVAGDAFMADRVYGSHRSHYLVQERGTVAATHSTRLVQELTGGRYQGTLFYHRFDDADTVLHPDVVQDEMKAGRLRGNQTDIDLPSQCVLLIGGHYVTLDNEYIIDDGIYKKVPQSGQFPNLSAVLEISRSRSQTL